MKNKDNPLAGMIDFDNQKLNFYLDGYTVTFMDVNHSHIKLSGQFIYGETYGFKKIAIYSGDNVIDIYGTRKLNTQAYMVAVDNGLGTDWRTFDYIEFAGGSLNSTFFCAALKREFKANDESIIYHRQDDSKKWVFKTEDCECELVVESAFNEELTYKGSTLSDRGVRMLLKFSNPQPLEKALGYVVSVKKVLSIMAFRKHIGFDEIYLHHNNRHLSRMQIFLKEEKPIAAKDIMRSITFHTLGDSVPELFSIVFNSKDSKPAYEFGFLPSTDRDITLISNDKVRLICSALECELSFIKDLHPTEEENLQGLIETVKDIVIEHKNGPDKLMDKTYDMIFSSIHNWSMTASDKICLLFHRYAPEMNILNRIGIPIGDKEICDFIKYRNSITHGSYRVLNVSIATTAFVLQGLVYCCMLTRIGMSRDNIKRLCNEGIILS